MDLLFLAHRLPYPPNRGDKIRSHAWLKHLSQQYRVHLGCFVDDPADMIYCDEVNELCGGDCLFTPVPRFKRYTSGVDALLSGDQSISEAYFGDQRLRAWVDGILRTKPIVGALVFSSSMAPYLLKNTLVDGTRVVFDMVDVDSDKWQQLARHAAGPMRWIYEREARTLAQLELDATLSFGATLLVSVAEVKRFRAVTGYTGPRIHAVSNGVDLESFAPGDFRSPYLRSEIPIVMTGRMDYRPNVDGARWFIDEVLPLIRQRIEAARFYVVGANPSSALRTLSRQDVVVTGQVADIRPYLQHAAAIVAPLKIARGLQNKVLEAFAMEKPVVATSDAVRALDVERGSELWVEDEAWGFARAVRAAVTGPERVCVAARGRAYVQRHHDWAVKLKEFEAVLEATIACPAADSSRMIEEGALRPIAAPRQVSAGTNL